MFLCPAVQALLALLMQPALAGATWEVSGAEPRIRAKLAGIFCMNQTHIAEKAAKLCLFVCSSNALRCSGDLSVS